ncbi:MAG: acyltransferase family protein [Lachnospiraceae bacterium]|nr:acyltransferase family protein [Lachnospiraceae bacterium]
MILVLLGHLQNDTIFSFSPYILSLCSWIFSFHMALFFIISGMLMAVKRENKGDFKTFIKKRFSQIMIPYFWFSLIYIFIVLYYLLINKSLPLKTLFVQVFYVIGMYGMNVLWFLPALFAAEVLFVLLAKHFKGIWSYISILILILLACCANELRSSLPNSPAIYERAGELITTILRPIFACSYIFIGYCIYGAIEKIKSSVKKPTLYFTLSLPILLAVNIYINTLNRPVDFRSLVFNNYIFYYISSVCGSLFLILLTMILSQVCPGKRSDKKDRFSLLTFYGINSLTFMAVHNNSAIMQLALKSAMLLNRYLTRARGYICYGVVILIYLIYVTLTILLINRFFPFLTGRKSGKRAS